MEEEEKSSLKSFDKAELEDEGRTFISKESKDASENTERKILIEERDYAAPPKSLGSTVTIDDNGINRVQNFKPYCDSCGEELEKAVICLEGGEKICSNCVVAYEHSRSCKDCYHKKYNLEKKGYKILFLIECGFNTVTDIHRLTKIPKPEIKETIASFLNANSKLVRKKGLRYYEVTEHAIRIMVGYTQIYDEDSDIQDIRRKIGSGNGL